MKRTVLIAVAFLGLAGCVTGPPGGSGPLVIGGSITNPISVTQVYQLESAYEAAFLIPAAAYVNLGLCPGASRSTFAAPCAERVIVRKIQGVKRVADLALGKLRAFVFRYPTLDATSYFTLAWQAVESAKAIMAASR